LKLPVRYSISHCFSIFSFEIFRETHLFSIFATPSEAYATNPP
jgi:hypothetical protein